EAFPSHSGVASTSFWGFTRMASSVIVATIGSPSLMRAALRTAAGMVSEPLFRCLGPRVPRASEQAARGELFGRRVDAVDRYPTGQPVCELAHSSLELDLRLVAEQLARACDVREAVADITRAPLAERLGLDVHAQDLGELR